jgi:opacity protein-like surface antigen
MKAKMLKSVALAALMAGGWAMAGGSNGVVVDSNGYKTGGFFGVRGSFVFSIQSSIIGMPDGSYWDDSYDGNGGSFGIHLGGQEGQWRATLAYEYFDNDDEQNYDLFMAQVDYFFLESPGAFQPYIGVNGGLLSYETKDADDVSGFAYGAAAGVNFAVNENIDLDFSLRYMFATQDEVDHIGSVNFSINYFY